jgi:hypothetical protein
MRCVEVSLKALQASHALTCRTFGSSRCSWPISAPSRKVYWAVLLTDIEA